MCQLSLHPQIPSGSHILDIARELEKSHFKRPRFAIGQSSEGDWLLIAY
jgi:hypothetical protein